MRMLKLIARLLFPQDPHRGLDPREKTQLLRVRDISVANFLFVDYPPAPLVLIPSLLCRG